MFQANISGVFRNPVVQIRSDFQQYLWTSSITITMLAAISRNTPRFSGQEVQIVSKDSALKLENLWESWELSCVTEMLVYRSCKPGCVSMLINPMFVSSLSTDRCCHIIVIPNFLSMPHFYEFYYLGCKLSANQSLQLRPSLGRDKH